MTTITRPYADVESRLADLAEEMSRQAERLDERARDLEANAEDQAETPPREEINRLYGQAENLRYQCQVLDAAARICSGRGTAAELVGVAYVLPPGFVAVLEQDADNRQPGRSMSARELRKRREALGLSLRALAPLLGVDYGTIHRWETGRRSIPPYLSLALDRLAEAVNREC